MDDFYEKIGSKIRNLRLKADISQEELGDHLDLTRGSIAKIESGKQRIYVHTLYEIAQACNGTVSQLLIGNEWFENESDDDELKQKILSELSSSTAQKITKGLDL